jgi:hypothetical protein
MSREIDVPRLLNILADSDTVSDLRRYYGVEESEREVPPYTGARFERLAGGGDRPATANHITADDLVAVETLSVRIPIRTGLDLLEGDLGQKIAGFLAEIPVDEELGSDAAAAHVDSESPAAKAWQSLTKQDHVGWVIAGKLLARKRPRLLPVYDQVIRCVLQGPVPFWTSLNPALRANDGALRSRLDELKLRAALPESIGRLRVLDVALWMRHQSDHTRRGCSSDKALGLA